MSYLADIRQLRRGAIDDGVMRFSRSSGSATTPPPAPAVEEVAA